MMRFFRFSSLSGQRSLAFSARRPVSAMALGGLLRMPLGLACLAVLGLGGCSSTATRYYALSPQPGAQAPSLTSMALPSVIEMRTPSITARLDRDGILQGMRDSQDHMIANAAWSESLDEMVGHTLIANLAQRLSGHVLFAQNDSVAVAPGAYLELSLTRFEEDASGHAVITGVLSAHRADAPAEQARALPVDWVSPQPVGGGQKALLGALNNGLGALADQAISLLGTLPQPQSQTQSQPEQQP